MGDDKARSLPADMRVLSLSDGGLRRGVIRRFMELRMVRSGIVDNCVSKLSAIRQVRERL